MAVNKLKGGDFSFDAIVLHADDELDLAEAFCAKVRKIDLADGIPIAITTFERFCMAGLTYVMDMDCAIKQARFILCSEDYYQSEAFGRFCGDVAIYNKLPDKFVKLAIGKKTSAHQGQQLPSMDSFNGLLLEPGWEIPEISEDKLKKAFTFGRKSVDHRDQDHQTKRKQLWKYPGDIDNQPLSVMNPSISSTVDSSDLSGNDLQEDSQRQINSLNPRACRGKTSGAEDPDADGTLVADLKNLSTADQQ